MRSLVAIILLLVLVVSFAAGILINRAEAAGGCKTYCEACTCTKYQCCKGVCTVIGTCWPICPACPPPV